MRQNSQSLEYGSQPIDAIMAVNHWVNADVVSASSEQLTHKMVAKARKGRRLSRKVQEKILVAMRNLSDDELTFQDLFNYNGG